MATAFETHQQAAAHANNLLHSNDNDANAPEIVEFMEKRLSIYPGPYRTAFRETIEARRKWQERKERFAGKVTK